MEPKLTHEERVAQEIMFLKNRNDFTQELLKPVRVSNEMIQKGCFGLSLRELRLLFYLFSQIKETDMGDERYKVSITTAGRMIGALSKDNKVDGKTYKAVFAAFSTLGERGLTLSAEQGAVFRCAFINNQEQDKSWNFVFNFNRNVAPYLFNVKKKCSRFTLDTVIYLRSSYGIRLYLLLLSYSSKNTCVKDFSLDELMFYLNADPDSYKLYCGFKSAVLLPAMRELKKTDIKADFIEIKSGKRVVALRFVITKDYAQYRSARSDTR